MFFSQWKMEPFWTAAVLCHCQTEPGNWKNGIQSGNSPQRSRSGSFSACMNWALEHGARRLLIYSNRKLKPALHIYEKYGFKEIPTDGAPYNRADIALEFIPA